MKVNLYRATVVEKEKKNNKDARRTVYLAKKGLIDAVQQLEDEVISADEMILDCNEVSEECYV